MGKLSRSLSRRLKKVRKAKFFGMKPYSVLHRIFWPPYETVRTAVAWPLEHRRYDPIRRRLIEGRRVMIVGSGPSAAELKSIPPDMVVLTCKRALKLFLDNGLPRPVNLYICAKGAMKRNPVIEELISAVKTDILVMDDLRYAKSLGKLFNAYRLLIPDDGKDNFYFKKLLGADAVREFKRTNPSLPGQKRLAHVSTGLRLLQYAVYFGAKEIYMAGIDLNSEDHFFGEARKQKHVAVDNYFMKKIAERRSNIFSVSASSPLCRYVPHRVPETLPEGSAPAARAPQDNPETPLGRIGLDLYRRWYGIKYALYHRLNEPVLRDLIKGRRVLIVGSGPSSADIGPVPDDVLTFTCNAGLKLWLDHKFKRKPDLYLCTMKKLAKKEAETLLPQVRARYFVTDAGDYVRNLPAFQGSYEKLLPYDLQRGHYLKKVLHPHRFRNRKSPSTGIRLLQYALYFGAKEIYIAGIDLGGGGYVWGGTNKQKHTNVDINFLKIVSQKYDNVFSLSESSPTSGLIPHKKL